MTTFVILLRGVNVGKAKRVPMAEFKALLLALGCTDARTLLNSGNAVVQSTAASSAALAPRVADAMAQRFGFEVPVVVKSAAELQAIVKGNPLTATVADASRLLVVLAQDSSCIAELQSLQDLLLPGDALQVQVQAAYLHCASGILESRVAAALLGKAGRLITSRNWATVMKLQTLLNATRAPD